MAIIGDSLTNPESGYVRYEIGSSKTSKNINWNYISASGSFYLGADTYNLSSAVGDEGTIAYIKIKNTSKFRTLLCLPSSGNASQLYTDNMVVEINGTKYTTNLQTNTSTSVVNYYLAVDVTELSKDTTYIVKIYSESTENDNGKGRFNIQAIDVDTDAIVGFHLSMCNMFQGCTSLTQDIIIPSNVDSVVGMFKNCTSMTHIHSNWNNEYNNTITSTDCYSGCTAITHVDNVPLILNEYTTALDNIPTAWGGYGFTREHTGIYKVEIPSDNFTFSFDFGGLNPSNHCFDDGVTSWGDGKTDSLVLSHTYERAGEYIIKTKMYLGAYATSVCQDFRSYMTEVIQYPANMTIIRFRDCSRVTSINVSGCVNATTINNAFYGCSALTTIIGVKDIFNSNVTSLYSCFYGCTSLTTLDLSNVNVSNVTEMSSMFQGCSALTELNIDNWNISNVTNMSSMFSGCTSLTQDIIIPSSVTDCSEMFKNCTSMTHIHSNWNNQYNGSITSTNCYSGCTGITHIDGESVLEGLDQVPIAWGGYELFKDVTTIIEVEIPSDNYSFNPIVRSSLFTVSNKPRIVWGDGTSSTITSTSDTTQYTHVYEKAGTYTIKGHFSYGGSYSPNKSELKKVLQLCVKQDLNRAFSGCSNLTYVNLSATTKETTFSYIFTSCKSLVTIEGLECINPTDISAMFYGCTSLQSLDLSNLNISKVTSIGAMFQNCSSLQSLNLSNWNVSKVTNMSVMFSKCTSLQSLDLSNWNVSNATKMEHMFENCSSLQSLDLSGWNVSEVTRMNQMFYGCSSLQSLNLSNWNASKVTDMSEMFYGCSSLQSLDLSNWNVSNVIYMNYMFQNCTSLQSLNLSNWNVSKVTNMEYMFQNCTSLQSLDLSNWNVSKVIDIRYMFDKCSNLTTLNLNGLNFSSLKINSTSSYGVFTGCASLKENPYLQLANLNNFYSIHLRGCDSLPKILDFQNIPLPNTKSLSFPNNTEQVIGVNTSVPLTVTFRFNSVINRFENLYFNSSATSNYWYYGGGASNMSVTFVGEIERIPSNKKDYVDCYKKGLAKLDEASKTSFVNALKDYTGEETAILYGASSYLSSEQIAIATAKNWSVT